MDDAHLSELAAQEWSRFGETRLWKEDDASLARHLEACSDCRDRVEAYRQLDLLVHPFGSPPPIDPRPRRFRRLLLAAVVVVVLATIIYVVFDGA